MLAERAPRVGSAGLAKHISRQLGVVLETVNVVSAVLTYVFVVYVVPLPGSAPPADAKSTVLIATIAGMALCELVCVLWGVHTFAPVRRWLVRGGEPDDAQRVRTVRIPLHE